MAKMIYTNDDLELEVGNVTYRVDVRAVANYTYIPGRMYMPNGDPGYLDEEDFEIEEVEATWYLTDENGIEKEVTETEEMQQTLDDYLYEVDSDNWDYDEPDPPEPDDLYDYE